MQHRIKCAFAIGLSGMKNLENVILLEIEPEKQKTRVDFELTKKMLGIEYVCISKINPRGEKSFSMKRTARKSRSTGSTTA
jgi:hypothetical protein